MDLKDLTSIVPNYAKYSTIVITNNFVAENMVSLSQQYCQMPSSECYYYEIFTKVSETYFSTFGR